MRLSAAALVLGVASGCTGGDSGGGFRCGPRHDTFDAEVQTHLTLPELQRAADRAELVWSRDYGGSISACTRGIDWRIQGLPDGVMGEADCDRGRCTVRLEPWVGDRVITHELVHVVLYCGVRKYWGHDEPRWWSMHDSLLADIRDAPAPCRR
jgi:hypothetical protein